MVFDLPDEGDGWPPAASERLWATRVGADIAKLDNIPFFVRGYAWGDLVRFTTNDDGVLQATELVEPSGGCTIRLIPIGNERSGDSHQAILDVFLPLGVHGEGFSRYNLIALSVPAEVDVAAVKQLVKAGEDANRWHYEEGCITQSWRDLP